MKDKLNEDVFKGTFCWEGKKILKIKRKDEYAFEKKKDKNGYTLKEKRTEKKTEMVSTI